MLHCIYHPSGVAAGRPFLNFASQLLDFSGHSIILIVEHPHEMDLTVHARWLIMPALELAYPNIDWNKVEMLWPSRHMKRKSEAMVLRTYNPVTDQFGRGWRNRHFQPPRDNAAFTSDSGFVGNLWEMALIEEDRLSKKEPYSE